MKTASILVGLTCIAGAALAAPPLPPSLEQGFRTCETLASVPLAEDLFWLLPKDEDGQVKITPEEFEARYTKAIAAKTLAITRSAIEGKSAAARVKLSVRDLVAGLTPKFLSVYTCEDACDVQVWTLEFGQLNDKDKANLKAWLKRLPPATDQETRPGLVVDTAGNTSLACDLSL